jgi:hypothetical protein
MTKRKEAKAFQAIKKAPRGALPGLIFGPQKWVTPAGLTLPGHHAEFVFRLPKHKTTIADSAADASQKYRRRDKLVGESVDDSVHNSATRWNR